MRQFKLLIPATVLLSMAFCFSAMAITPKAKAKKASVSKKLSPEKVLAKQITLVLVEKKSNKNQKINKIGKYVKGKNTAQIIKGIQTAMKNAGKKLTPSGKVAAKAILDKYAKIQKLEIARKKAKTLADRKKIDEQIHAQIVEPVGPIEGGEGPLTEEQEKAAQIAFAKTEAETPEYGPKTEAETRLEAIIKDKRAALDAATAEYDRVSEREDVRAQREALANQDAAQKELKQAEEKLKTLKLGKEELAAKEETEEAAQKQTEYMQERMTQSESESEI